MSIVRFGRASQVDFADLLMAIIALILHAFMASLTQRVSNGRLGKKSQLLSRKKISRLSKRALAAYLPKGDATE